MKKIRTILVIVIVALVSVAWIAQFKTVIGNRIKYNSYIKEAETYSERGLYQKSINSFEEALKLKNTDKTVWNNLFASYQNAYEEHLVQAKSYASAVTQACTIFESDNKYWELLLSIYLEEGDYSSAYSACKKMKETKAKSDELDRLYNLTMFSFKVKSKAYTDYRRSPNGYYTLFDDFKYGLIGPDGEWVYECDYSYAGGSSNNGNIAMKSYIGLRVYDSKGIVVSILDDSITECLSPQNGFIPLKTGDKWGMFDYANGKYVGNKYELLSSCGEHFFAANKNEKWVLVSFDGKDQSEFFDNIKLYSNGDYSFLGIMVASKNGKYGLFDEEGKEIGDATYSDLDCYYGDYIAFKDSNGKWGYIDKSGKLVIKPKFTEAKSFSNGLAAFYDGNNWGFINRKGDVVIEPQFKYADYITKNGVCLISEDGVTYHIMKLRFF